MTSAFLLMPKKNIPVMLLLGTWICKRWKIRGGIYALVLCLVSCALMTSAFLLMPKKNIPMLILFSVFYGGTMGPYNMVFFVIYADFWGTEHNAFYYSIGVGIGFVGAGV